MKRGGVFRGVVTETIGAGTIEEPWVRLSGADATGDGIDNDADGTTNEAGEVNLPDTPASDLIADPDHPDRFFAAIEDACGRRVDLHR